jgi:hypothetical protein
MAPVPSEATEAIRVFRERQWHVMALLARCPGALDLVRSTSALGFALASSWVFRKQPVRQPLRSARALLGKPQIEICDWLGFPARRSTINMLRKLPPQSISVSALLHLRDALWDEQAAKLLRHCPTLSEAAIQIAADPSCRRYFATSFLIDLVNRSEDPDYTDGVQVSHAVDWLKRFGISLVPVPIFRSTAELVQFDRDRRRRADDKDHQEEPAADRCPPELLLPPAPFPGTDKIIALTTGAALLRETAQMHNCVASLYQGAADGDLAFYSVLLPHRATLELCLQEGIWQPSQLLGPRNSPAPRETYAAVYGWLADVLGRSSPHTSDRCTARTRSPDSADAEIPF